MINGRKSWAVNRFVSCVLEDREPGNNAKTDDLSVKRGGEEARSRYTGDACSCKVGALNSMFRAGRDVSFFLFLVLSSSSPCRGSALESDYLWRLPCRPCKWRKKNKKYTILWLKIALRNVAVSLFLSESAQNEMSKFNNQISCLLNMTGCMFGKCTASSTSTSNLGQISHTPCAHTYIHGQANRVEIITFSDLFRNLLVKISKLIVTMTADDAMGHRSPRPFNAKAFVVESMRRTVAEHELNWSQWGPHTYYIILSPIAAIQFVLTNSLMRIPDAIHVPGFLLLLLDREHTIVVRTRLFFWPITCYRTWLIFKSSYITYMASSARTRRQQRSMRFG